MDFSNFFLYFSPFAKQNQAGVWPRFQSLLNPLAISRANGIGKLSRCGLPRTQRFQLLTPKNPLGYLPFPRFNHPFRKRPCPWWKSQSVSRVRLNFLIMRIPMKEMLIGASCPPRPALTRVCVPPAPSSYFWTNLKWKYLWFPQNFI